MATEKQKSLKELETLTNVGKITAERLYSLGIKNPEQLNEIDSNILYEKLKKKNGGKLDKCVFYQIEGAKKNKKWWKCNDKDVADKNKFKNKI